MQKLKNSKKIKRFSILVTRKFMSGLISGYMRFQALCHKIIPRLLN